MTIGERIKLRRKELGLSQEELANRLGNKSRASVCTVEKDKEDMTTTRIRQYADALETTPAYLMGWSDQVIPESKDSRKQSEERAKKLYEMYANATPEVQSAVNLLLESAQQKK